MLTATGCVNTTARPKSAYTSVPEALAAYESSAYGEAEGQCYGFIKNLAGLIRTVISEEDYGDWNLVGSDDDEDGSRSYDKTVTLYGYEATVTVGVSNKKDLVAGISITLTTGSPEADAAFAGAFITDAFAAMGSSYQSYLAGEKCSDKELKAVIAEADSSRNFASIWPKSSIKWSVMVSYVTEASGSQVTVSIL